MKLKNMANLVMVAALLWIANGVASAATNTWTGGGGDGNWTNALNWDPAVPAFKGTNTWAFFDNGSATNGAIAWGTPTDSLRITSVSFNFLSGARSYLFREDNIDNSGSGDVTTEIGMTSDQTFTGWRFGTTTPNFILNGSGDVTVSNLFHQIAWTAANGISINTVVTNDAVLTFGGLKAVSQAYGRRIAITKNGPGKLVLSGGIEYPYGTNQFGVFTSTTVRVVSGEIDVSAAALKLTNSLAATAYVIPTNVTYMLVDYVNATLVGNASFASVSNLPAGWEIFNDSARSRIVLRLAGSQQQAQRKGCYMVVR